MNPVGLTAQINIPVPEGLDLDEWIVPPPKTEKELGTENRPKTKKSKKAKEKDSDGSKVKGPKKKHREPEAEASTPPAEELTVEDMAERERVCRVSLFSSFRSHLCIETGRALGAHA